MVLPFLSSVGLPKFIDTISIKLKSYIEEELIEKIKIQAIKEKRSVSQILEVLIIEYLKSKENNIYNN